MNATTCNNYAHSQSLYLQCQENCDWKFTLIVQCFGFSCAMFLWDPLCVNEMKDDIKRNKSKAINILKL